MDGRAGLSDMDISRALDGDHAPGPATELFIDHARSIITRNSSADIPFNLSMNPYRGCEHGCVYCLRGDTRILMADGSERELSALRVGDEIVGTEPDGWYGKYARTKVVAHWETWKPAYRVGLAGGTELVASGDHRFLTERGWKHVTAAESTRRYRPALGLGPSRRLGRKPQRHRRTRRCRSAI